MNSLQFLSSIPIRHFTLPFIIAASAITTLHSEENFRPNSLWPDGVRLTHPEHFVTASVVDVVRDDTLKLRAGPGTRFAVLVGIPASATDLTAFDQDQVWDGDAWWCPVDWEGYRGYAARAHLSQEPAEGPIPGQDLRAGGNPQVQQPPDVRPSHPEGQDETQSAQWPDGTKLTHPEHFVAASVVNVARGDTLKLRAGPGTRFVALTDIPASATDLTAFDQDQVWDGDAWWSPVDWEGYRGYVASTHLSQEPAEGYPPGQDPRAAGNPQVEQPADIRPSDRSLPDRVTLGAAGGNRQGDRHDPYRWKVSIVTTIFWIGERPSRNNPVTNCRSAWDKYWVYNYGGYDSPDPAVRRHFIPVHFVPRENPFYVALPYNDVVGHHTKREAAWVVPWFRETFVRDGQSVLKDRWIAIRHGNRVCYAQWEDCGPFRTDHWQYVFGQERPRPNLNQGAGLDVSPAVRDYLGLAPTRDICDWKFVEFAGVPSGPWLRYGQNGRFALSRR